MTANWLLALLAVGAAFLLTLRVEAAPLAPARLLEQSAEAAIVVHHKPGHTGGRGRHLGWSKKNRGKHKGWR